MMHRALVLTCCCMGLAMACRRQERIAPPARSSPPAAAPDRPRPFTDADYARHVTALRRRAPAGFTIVVQKPFVVLGDEAPDVVRRWSMETVKWAADRLKALFFERDPLHILDVWLFRDRQSYLKHTRLIFNDTPSTPFGYYSSTHRALVMNIATGGGTLVHEIVHPFMEANFPGVPAWFNEGLGSLYEQCREQNGRIWGLTNWRLAGLQKAIQAGRLPAFRVLTATTDHQFYNRDPGTNYAQARYLCYYLQAKGKLVAFYRAFHAARKADPTGLKTLQKVLGESDLSAFQRRWEAWVLKLRFPPSE